MQEIALIAAIALPLFNIPLIVRVIKRKSSADISLVWAVGVWTCMLLMVPSAFVSSDIVWRVFSIMNFLLFTLVFITVIIYRKAQIRTKTKGGSL